MGKRKKQDKKQKVALVFDENQRKDFLCGFRKRKLERKKKAQEEIQRMLKEEKKRIKLENKESYKKLVVSSRPIPDIDQLLKEEYEDEDVNVKIVELSSDTLQKKDLVIGENRPKEVVEKKQTKKLKETTSVSVPGMGSDTEIESAAEDDEEENEEVKPKSKKELKQMLMKQAQKKMQKSKVFQMKSKLDRVQNKKKSQQKKDHKARLKAKIGKPRKDKPKKSFGRKKH